jgi:hypothetical protein
MFAPDIFAITATSLADPSRTAFTTVTAIPLHNQEAQAFPIVLGASGINAKSQDCCSGTSSCRRERKANGSQHPHECCDLDSLRGREETSFSTGRRHFLRLAPGSRSLRR